MDQCPKSISTANFITQEIKFLGYGIDSTKSCAFSKSELLVLITRHKRVVIPRFRLTHYAEWNSMIDSGLGGINNMNRDTESTAFRSKEIDNEAYFLEEAKRKRKSKNK
ncbi:hypothetical protein A5844_001673 [Enterococcus sp. 10A9_DIV0425]|uniref:Uncharacterized protein n=1 Tax=Candidatus Enterococcus wittei TaxID=1987383 RepID=A0A242JXC9_9ENTE|nr:hypothetical protein A5844_001673 [Enterococcus sp. 10A9_DIV0425]